MTMMKLLPPWTHALAETQKRHAIAVVHGYLPSSVSLSASLILAYASHDRISSAATLFHQCRRHISPVTTSAGFLWNTMIRAFSMAGSDQGLQVYNQMGRTGIAADYYTFPFVIKACLDFSEVGKGLEVHGSVIKRGLIGDVFVANNMLMFYGGGFQILNFVVAADKLFDEMSVRDLVSWNTIMGVCAGIGSYTRALNLFKDMITLESGFMPNIVTVVTLLPVCAAIEDVAMVSQIHSQVFKLGLDDDQINVSNALVDAYGKCGDCDASMRVFDEMAKPNAVSWNSVIASCSYRGRGEEAFKNFRLMVDAGEKPNAFTMSSFLPVLIELEYYDKAKEIHTFCIRMGVDSEAFVANSLIDMYAKSGHPCQASNVFHKMSVRNVVSWNAMIANYSQNKLESAALGLVRQMQEYGESPNSVTFTNVLPACARLGYPLPGKEIHARSLRMGSASDLFVSNALTDMYAKCGCLNLARRVFDTSLRDEVSYNILVTGYSETNDCMESLKLFRQIGLKNLKYDVVSYVGALSACANLNAFKQGKEIHGFLVRRLCHFHLFAANSLLDLYTKCGRIDLGMEIFNKITNKDTASWNTVILGHGMLGNIDIAFALFEAMREDNVECDSVSYIAVLSACSHGGLVEKGKHYFREMQTRNIIATQMHYACMVDLLGRAGLMKEAADLIKGLSFEPDANIWGALLGAARINGDLQMGSWAADHLFQLKPEHCGFYVLLSNMYAEAGKWHEAMRIRTMMKTRGVKKSAAYSWVQDRDQNAFLVGDNVEVAQY